MPTPRLAKNDLNYTSYADLAKHSNLLSEAQRDLLSHLNRRKLKAKWTGLFSNNASILTLTEYPDVYNHVHCGEKCSTGHVTCKNLMFCERCANGPAIAFLKKSVTRFKNGKWCFVTFSFNTPVPFASGSLTEAELRWRITRDALNISKRLWDGCVYKEELAITDFAPLVVRPHAHLLLFSKSGNLDQSLLLDSFQDAARPHHLVSELSFDFKAIRDLDEYIRVVRYLFKPMDLGASYRKAWAVLDQTYSGGVLRSMRREVNNGITDIVFGAHLLRPTPSQTNDGFGAADEGQRRTIYRGVLNSTTKQSILLSPKQITIAKNKIDRILKQGEAGAKRLRKGAKSIKA